MANGRWSIEELEALTPHELADLLAKVIMVLRRLPNVPLVDLEAEDTSEEWARHSQSVVEHVRHEKKSQAKPADLPDWVE
jgi:hypothetical protein